MSTSSPLSNVTPLWQSPAGRSSSAIFGPGTLVDGRYEIVRPIDRGGRCEIVEGRHLHTGRAVVLKLLRRDEQNRPEAARRLEREATVLGAIDHPGVVNVSDAGVCKVNGPYLVLEKLDGRSLEGLLTARGALRPEAVLTMLRQVVIALGEVHRRGYVHRDIRPGNVFVASSRVGGEAVHLLNFADSADVTRIDQPWAVLDLSLDPTGFKAPEQLGNPTLADPRSDLYALGVLAVASLGIGCDQLAHGRRDLCRATALLGDRSDLPPALLEILDSLLAFSPADRPQSAEAVLEALGKMGEPPVHILGYLTAEAEKHDASRFQPVGTAPRSDAPRRRHMRAPYITPVRILGEMGQIDGRSEDISSSGMLVVTRELVELEGIATVRFALPTTGRVVAVQVSPKWKRARSGRTAIGLEFVDIDPIAAQAIEDYARYMAVER